jgi:hypothetical protein
MSKHTPEPWYKFDEGNNIFSSNGHVSEILGHETHPALDISNAARIVACVNACATFDNDTLLDDGPRKLREDRDQLLAQRDELLEALEDFVADYERAQSGQRCSPETVYQIAKDAITKVKGGQS